MNWLGRVMGVAMELGLSIGLVAAVLVGGGIWLGRWLDERYGSQPIATVTLLLTGLIVSQVAVFRLAAEAYQELSTDAERAWSMRSAGRALGLALRWLALIALPGCLGLFIGLQLTKHFGAPLWVTMGLVLALSVAGFYLAGRLADRTEKGGNQEKTP